MCVILAITNNTNSKIQLIKCDDEDDAVHKMNSLYQNLCYKRNLDYNNTYFDKEISYAQIVSGFEQIEIRIGNLI